MLFAGMLINRKEPADSRKHFADCWELRQAGTNVRCEAVTPRQDAALNIHLTAVKAALADSSDTELAELIAATYGIPQTAGAAGTDLGHGRTAAYRF